MPTFQLSGPDGASYEVDAPDERAALSAFRGFATGQKTAQAPTMAQDVARSAVSGLERGAIGAAGIPGFLSDVADTVSAQTIGRAGNYARTGSWAAPDSQRYRDLRAASRAEAPIAIPDAGDVLRADRIQPAVESLQGAPLYEPQTQAGRFTQSVAEFAPNALGGGSAAQRLARAVIPGVAAEGAGQAAKQSFGPEAEPYARAAAGIVGAGAVGLAQANRGANALMSEGLQASGITRDELAAAYRLIEQGQGLANPVRLTLDEALNQVTGGRAQRLSQLRRVAEYSGGEGAQPLAAISAGRSAEVQGAMQGALGDIAPTPLPAAQAAQAGQEAAQSVIARTQAGINAMTRPAYQAADTARVGPQVHQALMSDPLYARTVAEIRSNPALGRTVENLPDDSGGMIDLVQRRLRESAENARVPGQATTSNTIAANFDDARQAPIAALETATGGPGGAYAQARQVQSDLRQQMLEPLTNGPIGRIADMDPGTAGASARMGAQMAGVGEMSGRYDAVIQQTARRLVRQNPEAAQTLARDYIGDVFDRAARDLQGGPNVNAGAVARQELFGSLAVRANVDAMLRQLPRGQQVADGFQKLMDVFQATGFRPARGSDTAFNQQIQREAKEAASAPGALASTVIQGGTNLRSALRDRIDRMRLQGNMAELAHMLTQPSARPLLEQLARTPADSAKALGLALRLTFIGEQASRARGEAQPVPRLGQ
ncbi:hypothetical protein [Methylobacterium sp. Gmos1]